MLYKFKSKVASDIIMLEPNGRHILSLWGRVHEAELRQGILLAADMPAAIAALEEAIAMDDAQRAQEAMHAQERGEERAPNGVGLRQRAMPLLEMARRSQAAGKDITWGV